MKTEKQINKLIDDLYFECIVDDQLDEAYQEGMQIYRAKLKESLKCLASDGDLADVSICPECNGEVGTHGTQGYIRCSKGCEIPD